jgi:hypothetical protein
MKGGDDLEEVAVSGLIRSHQGKSPFSTTEVVGLRLLFLHFHFIHPEKSSTLALERKGNYGIYQTRTLKGRIVCGGRACSAIEVGCP